MGGTAKVQRAAPGAGSRRRSSFSGRRAARGRALPAGQVLAPATLVLALAMGFAQASWAGAAVAPAGNLITPDGRTATSVVNLPGQITNVSTATVRAGVGYNSFSRFVVGAGKQVNLLVPASAGTLLNVVRDAPVDIEGTLRSYKNGTLGGNVVFADPNGLIVGRSGVVDVGGFTVVTPTSGVLDQLIDASGHIDTALSQRLLAGDVPLSADGSVLIQGSVRARGGVQIYAHDVLVAAASAQAPSAAQHDTLFQATVNTQGLAQGGAIVASGGSIRIVAAQDVTIDGTLSAAASRTSAGGVSVSAGRDLRMGGQIVADGAPGVNAGAITLHAGRDIDVAASSVLSAAGSGTASDGGSIAVKAAHDLRVASGATLRAQAGSSGNAGSIELSAQDTATLGSLQVNLGATDGRAGTLLIDPIDLVINAGNDSAYTTNGGSLTLLASHSITVAADGVIDTEASGTTGGGSISLSAPSITIGGGAQLLSGSGPGAGSIQLSANATPSYAAQIAIGDTSGQAAVLEGGNISLQATSQLAQNSYDHAVVSIQNADITAFGTLSAMAVASGGQQLTAIGASASADVLASVSILGDSNLSSSGTMTLSADANAAAASTAALPLTLSLPADAAAAVNQVTSVSSVEVGGSSTVSTTGAGSLLSLGATNTVSSSATADASGASAGASVAVNIVKVQTTAEIDGSASVHSAGDLMLSGTTVLSMSTAATASQGGASSSPDPGGQAAQYLSDPSYTPYLSTSDGSVGAAAALAISDLHSATQVDMSSTSQATAAGQVSLNGSAANGASVLADGSPAGDSTSKLGIGAAVALNLAHVSDDATVAQDIQAGSLSLSANMSGGIAGNAFSAQAVSGAGASSVGVAGSLATDLLDSEAEARVVSGTLSLSGGSGGVHLSSDDLTSSTVAALPQGAGVSGGKVGVGASVGLNIVATRSYAQLADGVALSGAGAVSLTADASHVVSTQADQGSAGGVSVTPVVALSLVNDQTQASIGALSGGLQATGPVQVTAEQTATEATEASGTAAGSKAAVGAALAVSVINDSVVATTSTSVDSTGDVGFSATGVSLSVASATASASGGNGSNSDGSAPSGEDSSVDAKIQKQSDSAETKAGDAGVGSSSQQSQDGSSSGSENGQGSTSDGSVAVAAAIAVDVANSSVQAYVPAAVGVKAGGALSVSTVSNMDARTQADGSQVAGGGTSVGIGAAVAVTLAHQVNDATLGAGSALSAAPSVGMLAAGQYEAGSLSLTALQTDQGVASPAVPGSSSAGPATVDLSQNGVNEREDLFSASATSGAGASKVGVAGSLALDLVDSEAVAKLASGTLSLSGGSGGVQLSSDDLTSSTVAALPQGAGASGGKVGVGASVGLNIVATRSYAQLADGVALSGAGAVSLTADASHVVSTQADQGSAGGVSVTPVVALSLVNDQTQASIGALSGGLQATGPVQVTAEQTATEATEASGTAAGSKAAVGAALAVSVINDSVVATTSTSVDSTGDVGFSATGVSLSVASATASASGGNGSNSDGSAPSGEDSSVDAKIQKQSDSAETKAGDAGVGSSSQQSQDGSSSGSENGQGSTSDGSVAVAAAIAVDVANSSVQAYVPAAVGVKAGGALSVSTVSNMDARTQADGSQVAGGGTSVGIGAAVAVTLAHQVNDATLGAGSALSAAPSVGMLAAGQYEAGSLSLTALQTDQGVASPAVPGSSSAGPATVDLSQNGVNEREDLFSASATSGAGASKVGLAGSLAVNVIQSDSSASVQGSGTLLRIDGGAVDIGAANLMQADASATPSDTGASGGKLGVGASVALNTITETSQASIADQVSLAGTLGSLDVGASSTTDTSSTAQAGAAGGVAVDAVVAMSILSETTTATVGSGDAFTTAGGVDISASSEGTNTATATASVKGSGSSVAIGGSVALITGPGILGATSGGSAITSQTTASLNRDATIGAGLQILASSSRSYDAESTASASGNQFSSAMQSGNDSTSGGGSVASGDTLNTSQAQSAMSQGASDSGTTQSKASGSSGSQGKVSVAAAVGAAIVGDQVQASIGGGAQGARRTISVGGAVLVSAGNQGDVYTEGDGSTDTSSKVGVGVGVALSLVDNASSASIGSHTNLYTPGAVSVQAISSENQDPGFVDARASAVAMSGASAGKVAVAGSIAVAASLSSTSASIGDEVQIGQPGTNGMGAAGDLSVQADNTSSWAANAWSGSSSNQGVGIGASIAAVISTDSYTAAVGQNDDLHGASLSVTATNHKVDNPLSGVTKLAGDASSAASATSSQLGTSLSQDASTLQTTLTSLAGQGLRLALLGQTNFLAEAGAGAASGNSAAIAGAFAVEVVDNTVSAGIGASTTVHSTGSVSVKAADDTVAKALLGGAAASAGSAGVGVAGAFLYDDSSIQSQLGTGVDIASSAALDVGAAASQDVQLFGFSAGAADEAGVAGVIGLITSQREVGATVGAGSSIQSSGAVDVSASNDFSALNIGGSLGAGGSAGVGATLIATTITDGATALLDSSQADPTQVLGASSLTVGASTSENVINVAVAGSAGGDVAISGVATPLTEVITTAANIGSNALITTSGELEVDAADQSQVVNVGGGVAAAGSVGVGLTAAVTTLDNSITAGIGSGAQITAASLDVQADASTVAYNIAVAGGIGGDVGVSGVLTPVTQTDTVSASIGQDVGITTTDAATGFVDVNASNNTHILNVGGAIGVGGAAGVGGSAAASVLDDTTQATMLDGTSVSAAGAVQVGASADENVSTAVITGAAGGSAGVAVALASSDIVDTTQAYIGYGATVDAASVDVAASDLSTISDIAGAAGGGGAAGVGAGVDVNVLKKNTHAWIGIEAVGAQGTAALVHASSGDVTVQAASSETLSSVVAGAAVGGAAGVAGAVQTYVLLGDTEAGIGAGDTVTAYGNVAVLASDDDGLGAVVGGAAGGGAAGVGASIGVSVVQQTTLAGIGAGAQVSALGNGNSQSLTSGFGDQFNGQQAAQPTTSDGALNEGNNLLGSNQGSLVTRTVAPITRDVHGVLVNAVATASLDAAAVSGAVGGAVGAAISGAVPVVISDTEASIGSGAVVDGGANSGASAAQSVAVAAASNLYVRGITGAGGGGGAVGVGAGLLTNVIDNTTKAFIDGGASVAAQSNVDVSANAGEDFSGLTASAGLGGVAGIAGGATVLVVDDTTLATIDGTVDAGGSVVVSADDQTNAALTAGSAGIGGAAGVGAGIGVAVLIKDTEAHVGSGAVINAGGQGSDSAFLLYTAGDSAATSAGQGLLVSADSAQSLDSLALAGAGGAYAGVAGAVSVQAVSTTTIASIDGGARINTQTPGAGSGQNVDVAARDNTALYAVDASAGVGIAGVGGSVNVAVLTSNTQASIGDNAVVDAAGAVSVAAYSNKAVDASVFGVGGGVFGLGASINVLAISNGQSANGSSGSDTQTIGALTTSSGGQSVGDNANSQMHDNTIGNDYLSQSSNSDVSSASASAQSTQDSTSASAVLSGQGQTGTSASIGNATVHAGGSITVASDDKVTVSNLSGALGAGGVGIGAGVGVAIDNTRNSASVSGAAGSGASLSGSQLEVSADTQHTLGVQSYAGGVGLLAGADAVVAYTGDSSQTQASVSDASVSSPGEVDITATSNRALNSTGSGAAAGGMAAGAAVSIAQLSGSEQASADAATFGTPTAQVGSVDIQANSTDSANASSLAVSAGIGIAVEGSVATATLSPQVQAFFDNGSIDSAGAVNIGAEADNLVAANASGGALALLGAAGASVATATQGAQVSADVNTATIDAASLSIDAGLGQASPPSEGVSATASGASGALFVGINASAASAINQSSAIASAEYANFDVQGLVDLEGQSQTAQSAVVTGYVAAGLLALGANEATATSTTTTHALLSDMSGLSAGSLTVNAAGNDGNVAQATAGSGAAFAGSAAQAMTVSQADTQAGIENLPPANAPTQPLQTFAVAVPSGQVRITATHTASFGGGVDSTNAAIVGASGATLDNQVHSVVAADLGPLVHVVADGFTLDARNLVGSLPAPLAGGWNVQSGSGGLLNAPAAGSDTTLGLVSTANVGDGASVHLLAQADPSSPSLLFIEAYNDPVVQQSVKMDSGGAIALAEVSDNISVNDSAVVSIGNQSQLLVDAGDIQIGAWGNASLYGLAYASTYGLAGAPTGQAHLDYTGNDLVSIGTNAQVQASHGVYPAGGTAPTDGTVRIAAGDSPTGQQSSLSLDSEVQLYNNTAIPIPTPPDAQSNIVSNALVAIAADPANQAGATDPAQGAPYGVSAAGDITISADKGAMSTTATGTGTNIYLEALSKVASAVSNLFGGGSVSFKITGGSTSQTGGSAILDQGLVDTGIQRQKTLTIRYANSAQDAGGSCDPSQSACLAAGTSNGISYTTTTIAPGGDLVARYYHLQQLLAEYSQDPIAKGAYQNEINFIEKELIGLGMGSIDTNGDFVLSSTLQASQQAAQQNLGQDQQILSFTGANLGVALTSLSGNDAQYATAIYNLSLNQQSPYSLVPLANAALGIISGMNNYAAYTAAANGNTPAAAGYSELQDLGVQEQSVRTAVGDITNEAASNTQAQTDITGQVSSITTMAVQVNGASATSARTLSGNFATLVANAQGQISGDLQAIDTNLANEDKQAATIYSAAQSLNSDLSALAQGSITAASSSNNAQNALHNQDEATYAGLVGGSGALYTLNNVTLGGLQNLASNMHADYLGEHATYGVLSASSSTAGSLAQYASQLVAQANTVAGDLVAAATSPVKVLEIQVAPVYARIGNVNLNADVLTTSTTALTPELNALLPVNSSYTASAQGIIAAPGDALIRIDNYTANPLAIGSLTIPAVAAGYVVFNGTDVSTPDQVTAINVGGAASDLEAQNLITRANSAAPAISITSNYNPNDGGYYNSNYSGSLYYLKHQMIAPDLTLNQGAAISNANGPVTIVSYDGNIYQDGSIDAQSLSITAYNGDYSSSYTDSIDNQGGNPATQNPATTGTSCADAAGNAITGPCANQSGLQSTIVNGNISIAARYLNINSLIQSGMVDNALSIASGDLLTTSDLASIGESSTNPTIAQYTSNPVAGAGSLVLVNTDSQGHHLWVDTANGQVEFKAAYANDYYQAHSTSGANFVYKLLSPGSTIQASYDATQQRYVVDPTEVHGGYIQLYGQIIDSSPTAGKLSVLDGFGSIDIQNQTSAPVVLSSLSTGADTAGGGRGTEGMIQITDVRLDPNNASVVDWRQTQYTYDPAANQVQSTVSTATLGVDGLPVHPVSSPGTSVDGRDTTYAPLSQGARYVFATQTQYTKVTNFSTTSANLFGSSSLSLGQFSNVDNVQVTANQSEVLPNGSFISTSSTQTGGGGLTPLGSSGQYVVTSDPGITTVPNSTLESKGSVQSTTYYLDSWNQVATGSSSSCNWLTLCVVQNDTTTYQLTQHYTQTTKTSLKADYPIGIDFQGSSTGSIQVQSVGSVVLDGALGNASGSTSINVTGAGASIVAGATGATITAHDIGLQAAGSIGGVTDSAAGAPVQAPVSVQLTGGALSAVAGANGGSGDVSISGIGQLVVDQVSANAASGQSAVSLSADQGILGANPGSLVRADAVWLDAGHGDLGGVAGGALAVDTGFTTDQNLRPFGPPTAQGATLYYGLQAQAAGDIDILSGAWADNPSGNLLADTVVSLGGDVTLSAPGQILDNNPVQTIDQRTQQQLLSYWQSLGLTAGQANTQKIAQTQSAYQSSVTQEYQQYWAIRLSQPDHGLSYDPNYQVSFSQQQRDALDAEDKGVDITALEQAQTQQYHTLNSEVGGLTSSYVANYQYHAPAATLQSLTQGATWTNDELSFSLSAALLKTVTNTNDVVKAPNVSGRTVSLDAGQGVGETIQTGNGSNNQYGTVIAAGTRPSTLSVDQQAQLASAEASDLQLTVAYAGGTANVPLDAPYSALSAQQQAALDAAASGQAYTQGSYLTILTKRPLNVSASGSLNLSVQAVPNGGLDIGNAYVASRGSLALGSIVVPGEARIKVLDSIANAGASNIATGNIILEAADGTIGNLLAHGGVGGLALALDSGATITARAQDGVYLAAGMGVAQDALVSTLYSPGTVSLSAPGSILNAGQGSNLNILADQVDLSASGGSIGAQGDALNVGVTTAGGSITADAPTPGQSVWLYGPAGYAFVIGGVDSGDLVNLQSAGDSTIAGAVDALGQVALQAGGEQVFGAGGSVLSTAGSVTLGADSLKMLNGSGIDALVGDISIDTTGDALVTGLNSGSGDARAVLIDAGGHVLAGTAPGRTDILADAPGAGVSIQAGLGIGDETEADTEAFDAPGEAPGTADSISPTPNPLIIGTGSLTLSSTQGDIDVITTAPVGAGSVAALDGSVNLLAQQDLSLSGISAALGSISVQGDGAVTLGTVSSGGSQSLQAAGPLTLGDLLTTGLPTDPGNIVLGSSGGGIRVTSVNGHAGLSATAQGSIEFGALSIRGPLDLSSQTSLSLPVVTVGSGSSFAAPTIDIAGIVPAAGSTGPFELDLGGPQGSVGLYASVSIDTTLPVVLGSLRESQATIQSNSPDFRILDGYILQNLVLSLPDQLLDINSQSPRPAGPQIVSIYNPGLSFQLSQLGDLTLTTAFFVNNTTTSQLGYLLGKGMIQNQNFVDDFVRGLRNGDAEVLAGDTGQSLGSWFSVFQAPPLFGSDFGFAWPSQPAVDLQQPGGDEGLRRKHGALIVSRL